MVLDIEKWENSQSQVKVTQQIHIVQIIFLNNARMVAVPSNHRPG